MLPLIVVNTHVLSLRLATPITSRAYRNDVAHVELLGVRPAAGDELRADNHRRTDRNGHYGDAGARNTEVLPLAVRSTIGLNMGDTRTSH